MNKKNGIIVRLIDVVLNLLMGFLLISDIVHKEQIKLPGPASSRDRQEQKEKVVSIEVKVIPSDTTLADVDSKTEKSLIKLCQLHSIYEVHDNEEIHKYRILENLEDYLYQTKLSYEAGGAKVAIVIDPDPESMIQATINVIDICRKYNIKRNFRYYENE